MEISNRILSQERVVAEEELLQRQQRLLMRRSEFVAQINRIDTDYRKEMTALIGEKKIKKNLKAHKKK